VFWKKKKTSKRLLTEVVFHFLKNGYPLSIKAFFDKNRSVLRGERQYFSVGRFVLKSGYSYC
jgi:hypothetical protein